MVKINCIFIYYYAQSTDWVTEMTVLLMELRSAIRHDKLSLLSMTTIWSHFQRHTDSSHVCLGSCSCLHNKHPTCMFAAYYVFWQNEPWWKTVHTRCWNQGCKAMCDLCFIYSWLIYSTPAYLHTKFTTMEFTYSVCWCWGNSQIPSIK